VLGEGDSRLRRGGGEGDLLSESDDEAVARRARRAGRASDLSLAAASESLSESESESDAIDEEADDLYLLSSSSCS
jgi:hypothetical protein